MAAMPAGTAVDAHAEHVMPGDPSQTSSLRAPGTEAEETVHGPDQHGRANAAIPTSTKSRLAEPGLGLGQDGWRVFVYSDIEAPQEQADFRAPDREIELHLTGNMERFQWSIDGAKSSSAEPIHVALGERIRLTLVNDTMMNHPMHLHGMWMELENGKGSRIPRVHTVNVKPAERMSLLFTADAPGPWAFHCHVLYHMEAGMFRVFHVDAGADPHAGHDMGPA
jgi:FtsP/CotA-like multicopper oxidase with cupredoxin domain